MSNHQKKSNEPVMQEHVPYTMLLADGRTLFVLLPGAWCGRDRDGELTFKPQAVRFLDRVRVLAMAFPKTPTPGFIRTLREALSLTQAQLGSRLGVDKLTIYRWERGLVKPGPASLKALDTLRRQTARKGIVIAA